MKAVSEHTPSQKNEGNKTELMSLVTRGDIILIAALLAVCAVLFVCGIFAGDNVASSVAVSVCGETYARLPLDKDTTLTVTGEGGIGCTVEVKAGRVRMVEAGCPDGLCVGQGWIDRTGEVIVCLPARVTVTLEGAQGGIDAVST